MAFRDLPKSKREIEFERAMRESELREATCFRVGELAEVLTDHWELVRVLGIVGPQDFAAGVAKMTGVPVSSQTSSVEVDEYAQCDVRDFKTGKMRPMTSAEKLDARRLAKEIRWVSYVFLDENKEPWKLRDGTYRTGFGQYARKYKHGT